MTKPWRRLALAAALYVTVGAGVAAAQTVIVRNAPAGAAVDVLFEGARLAAGTADELGDLKLPIQLKGAAGTGEADVRIHVDVCGGTFHVGLVDRLSLPPAPQQGCERRDVVGLYVVKSVTTLLVDVGGGRAALWLRQGPVPKEWMLKETDLVERPAGPRRPSPTGLVLFGAGGQAIFRSGVAADCGNVEDCTSKNGGLSYVGGAAIWVTRFLAIEGAYVKPKDLTSAGKGTGSYRFDSTLESQFVTGAVKIGIPIGPFRPYGIAGTNYHRALHTSTQVNEPRTVTINEVDTTIPGNTQTWATATGGLGWLFGGGAEVWVTRRFGLFGEIKRATVKGKGLDKTEGTMDDRTTFFLGGFLIKIGK
jgi:hypothetical protein